MSSDEIKANLEHVRSYLKEAIVKISLLKDSTLSKGLPIASRLDVALFFLRRASSILESLSIAEEAPIKPVQGEVMDIEVEQDLLAFNRRIALENRRLLDQYGIRAIDFMGSLGAGKTSIIETLIDLLKERYRIAVIVGDVATSIDADRLSRHGVKAIQVNTGKECHLDAQLVRRALQLLDLSSIDLLFIENVGNLICPAEFLLGTHARVVVVSVSEGSDMIVKHPLSFKDVDVVVINKIDVAKVFDVNPQALMDDVRRLNPKAKIVLTSVKERVGLNDLIKALNL